MRSTYVHDTTFQINMTALQNTGAASQLGATMGGHLGGGGLSISAFREEGLTISAAGHTLVSAAVRLP